MSSLIFILSCQKAGDGGKATITVYPAHHGNKIMNRSDYADSVFVKYNSNELPGTRASDYNAIFTGTTGNDYVACEGLKAGKYFIYCTGFDTTGPYRVKGGLPVNIKYKDRKQNIKIDLPITE